jgi:polysaccharide biosynthesis/export protein
MTSKIISAFIGLCTIVLIYGCGGGAVPGTVVSESSLKAKQESSEMNSKLLMRASSGGVESPADYIIGPADLLQVDVFESEKLTDTSRVSSRGDITLPLIGNVSVGGLSAREAEIKIENILKDQGFIKDPHVTVFIEEYNSKIVTVVGMVEEPGNHSITGRQTLLDVLVAAKGFQEQAGRTVFVNRSEGDGNQQTYMVDLDELLLKGNSNLNIIMKPGDVVYVPQAGNVYIEGAVGKSGSYPIKKDLTTVSQILTVAGGVAPYGDASNIKLIRYLGDGNREISQLDLEKITSGQAEDPIVKDRDALIVGYSTSKRILYGLRLGLGFGLFNVGYAPPETRGGF